MFDVFTPRNEAKHFLDSMSDKKSGMLLGSLLEEHSLIVEVVGPVVMLQRGEGRATSRQTFRDQLGMGSVEKYN
ncbi:rCG22081 [Rattus norvegicus]|uniref:RCG22081 n=1 Tax=Rattus norvegicus TaxID=10116 RepID=A6K3S4_RAT|nr:rCG22081 [Rattus norvegicus]